MLVDKKEEWYIYEEQAAAAAKAPLKNKSVHTNCLLRVKCLITVMLVALFAGYFTVQSEAIIRSGYTLVQTKGELAKVERENEALRLDIARLKAPQRIQKIAINEMGMIVPKNMYSISSTSTPNTGVTPQNEKTVAGQLADYLKGGKAEKPAHN
ncbi:MAG: cell division protein FtsL [Pelosinus sp.]|nr:cell division protein FtsL [Pelosinus sp.]